MGHRTGYHTHLYCCATDRWNSDRRLGLARQIPHILFVNNSDSLNTEFGSSPSDPEHRRRELPTATDMKTEAGVAHAACGFLHISAKSERCFTVSIHTGEVPHCGMRGRLSSRYERDARGHPTLFSQVFSCGQSECSGGKPCQLHCRGWLVRLAGHQFLPSEHTRSATSPQGHVCRDALFQISH